LKTIINAVINEKINWERMIGDGGMPSAHSARVTSICVFSALRHGANSYEFAISAILAIIVCHDAMGVRLETGKQAVLLNEIIEEIAALAEANFSEVKLKEFVGHTPSQVAAGILIGIIMALFMHFFVF
jgi:acid phosphatase family membrane protein YuiD